jgi:hypothetical protein
MQALHPGGQLRNPLQSHKLGFGTSVGSTGVDGCATNVFLGPGFGEILEGQLAATLPAGTPPAAAWVVLDANDDGIGTFDAATQTWTPGPDDYVYPADAVRVGGVLLSDGGAANLPVGGSSGSAIPAIVVPEPGFAALLVVGMLGLGRLGARRRTTRGGRPTDA